jgi:5-methylcytosine-specific restriction endonuclease McrA
MVGNPMLLLVDGEGRQLYRLTSSGNLVRTRKVPKYRRQRVLERDGNACVLCGTSGQDLEVDHIVRYADGGSNQEDNLRTLCRPCHGKRGGRA